MSWGVWSLNFNEFLCSHTSLRVRLVLTCFLRLRPESDRNLFDLLVVKKKCRKNGRRIFTPSNTVSVETCIHFLKNIEKVVIELFVTFIFFKQTFIVFVCAWVRRHQKGNKIRCPVYK